MTRPLYDAAVVGGGPAGLSAAITLAARGLRVVLFESRAYPHDKLCGEFLSPECVPLLDALDAGPALRRLGPVPIHTTRITAPGGAVWEARLPGTALGVSRAALDDALAARAREAGVQVCEGTTVSGIGGSLEDGFTLSARAGGQPLTVRARVVVGAHGKRSPLDRALERRFLTQRHPFVALKAHFEGPPVPGRVELHAFPGGYCGFSEVEGGLANVCLLVRESVLQAHAGAGADRLDGFVRWMQTQNPHLGEWLASARRTDPRWLAIGQVAFSRKRPVVRGVLMAGDSAGLIAPLAGNGIAMALRGGQLAAAHAAAFLEGAAPPRALLASYTAAWVREFRPRLRLGRALQSALLRPALATAALRVIAGIPPLGGWLVRHSRDVEWYKHAQQADRELRW